MLRARPFRSTNPPLHCISDSRFIMKKTYTKTAELQRFHHPSAKQWSALESSYCCHSFAPKSPINKRVNTYLGGRDAAGSRGLSREKAVEVVSSLEHGTVARDVCLRTQNVKRLATSRSKPSRRRPAGGGGGGDSGSEGEDGKGVRVGG